VASIRVVLAEDNALLREGITRMIKDDDDFDLAGVAADYPELIHQITTHDPDVVVTDIRMPPPAPTRASARRRGCARTGPRSASSC